MTKLDEKSGRIDPYNPYPNPQPNKVPKKGLEKKPTEKKTAAVAKEKSQFSFSFEPDPPKIPLLRHRGVIDGTRKVLKDLEVKRVDNLILNSVDSKTSSTAKKVAVLFLARFIWTPIVAVSDLVYETYISFKKFPQRLATEVKLNYTEYKITNVFIDQDKKAMKIGRKALETIKFTTSTFYNFLAYSVAFPLRAILSSGARSIVMLLRGPENIKNDENNTKTRTQRLFSLLESQEENRTRNQLGIEKTLKEREYGLKLLNASVEVEQSGVEKGYEDKLFAKMTQIVDEFDSKIASRRNVKVSQNELRRLKRNLLKKGSEKFNAFDDSINKLIKLKSSNNPDAILKKEHEQLEHNLIRQKNFETNLDKHLQAELNRLNFIHEKGI